MDKEAILGLRAASKGDLSPLHDTNWGICGNFLINKVDMEEACQGWEHYSGCGKYPINPVECETAAEQYRNQPSYKMWVGEYGRRRMELAGRLADMFEKRQEQHNG